MASTGIAGSRIAGIAASVPATVVGLEESRRLVGDLEARRVSQSTGIIERRVALPGTTAADLCQDAAERLVTSLAWRKDTIDALIFVTETPDYIVPATACCLQARLGLGKACAAFDVNLGCSGYVYGLWLAMALAAPGRLQRILVLTGDKLSSCISPEDRSVAMLFGDAGTATAIEADASGQAVSFELGTDGTGYGHLIIPAGAARFRGDSETSFVHEKENGNYRSDEQLFMDGAEIFAFALREVPQLIQTTLSAHGWGPDVPDAYVLHQANEFLLRHIAKKCGIPADKLPLSLHEYGYTSCASIPLTICQRLGEAIRERSLKLVLAGFGAGLSWAAAALTCGPAVILEPVVYGPASEAAEYKHDQSS